MNVAVTSLSGAFRSNLLVTSLACAVAGLLAWIQPLQAHAEGHSEPHLSDNWYSWRGPTSNGVAYDINLNDTLGEPVWTYPIKGGGTPVAADGRLYIFGYTGERDDLREMLLCLDAHTGEKIWQHEFTDFVSDIIYNRYGIGSPEIDPETGNVYLTTSPGLLMGFTSEGEQLWERSLMEEFGRLTFPNGRTGSARIDGDLVIIHGITANWGLNGAPRDRFYAFDKHTGELIWYCTPAIAPKDSSYSTPIFDTLKDGTRVFYAGTGCGNVVCIDARTGDPLWRFHLSTGGINGSPVLYGEDQLIILHGKENLDKSTSGRMVSLRVPQTRPEGDLPILLGKDAEVWRNNDLSSFSSSPTLKGDFVYQTTVHGELKKLDARTGEIVWVKKLAPDQLHASPLYLDGKIYAPFLEGSFFVVKDGDTPELLDEKRYDKPLTGQPMYYEGKLYLEGKGALYVYDLGFTGIPQESAWDYGQMPPAAAPSPSASTARRLIPPEFRLQPGESVQLRAERLIVPPGKASPADDRSLGVWEKFVPEGARVRAEIDAEFTEPGLLVAEADANQSAGAVRYKKPSGAGAARGRVVIGDTYDEDFEDFALDQEAKDGTTFGYPPLPWLGARFRYQVIEEDDGQILANTLDNVILQRSRTFIGDPEAHTYTMEVDVKTDGNRRISSTAGVINQRYEIALVGNWRILEVTSNHDRLKVSVPFPIRPGTWYRLKTRVDVDDNGDGMIRAKAWPRDNEEPEAWTLEVPVKDAHTQGSPGLYAFSPQAQKRVYFDNLKIYPSPPYEN
ncbi:MAG: PQQ-binding-like beta-propeller repeat protein [Opitutales bacterium]